MDYLAFDFGDGTTTAAHYNDSFNGGEPRELPIVKGENEIWSCIGFDRRGENPVIGRGADMPDYEVKANWKSYPSRYKDSKEGREDRRTAVAFMKKVFSSFLEQNTDYHKDGTFCNAPCKIVIGVPCDWSSEDMREYQKMALEAGIPNADVIKESQAAMFYARSWMRNCISDDAICKGVLLIDIGSSTTDFTFMKGADIVHHRGVPLGAKFVEEMMLVEGMVRDKVRYWPSPTENPEKIKILANTREEGISSYKTDLMDVRLHKEFYFTKADYASAKERTSRLPNSNILIGESGYITAAFVDKCLNESDREKSPCVFTLDGLSDAWGVDRKIFLKCNSWRGHFRNALECIKRDWNLGADTQIVVTGGATRMQFIEDDILDVFCSRERPHFGDDGARSFSVVKGLAWAAFAKHTIGQYREKLLDVIKGSDEITNILEKYVEGLLKVPSEKIAQQVLDVILPMLDNHKGEIGSLRKLNEKFSSVLCEAINSFFEETNKGIDVSDLLSQPEIKRINSNLQTLFARPEITIEKTLTASIPWKWKHVDLTFDPFQGCVVRPDSMDESFDGIFGRGMMYDNAASGFRNNFSASTVLDVFKTEEFTASSLDGDEASDVTSDFVRLMISLAFKIYEFKMSELDAILGAFEYDKKDNI